MSDLLRRLDGDPTRTALGIAYGRIAVGAAFLLAPRRLWGLQLRSGTLPDEVLTPLRMAAARDLALGVGSVLAARRGSAALRGWTEAGVVADAADALLLARDRTLRPVARILAASAATAAVISGRRASSRL